MLNVDASTDADRLIRALLALDLIQYLLALRDWYLNRGFNPSESHRGINTNHQQVIAFEDVLDIIMDSNESKLGAHGNPIYDANGKFLKGANYWKPEPKIRELLDRMMRKV